MSNIVVLQPDRSSRSPGSAEGRSADILFFTGVRYVRSTDNEREREGLLIVDLRDPAPEPADEERLQA